MEAINETKNIQENKESKVEENKDEEYKKPFDPFKAPEKWLSKIMWILGFPLNFLVYFTVPDTRRERFSKFPFYFITFLISTLYIGVFTYGLVWMVVIICKFFNLFFSMQQKIRNKKQLFEFKYIRKN